MRVAAPFLVVCCLLVVGVGCSPPTAVDGIAALASEDGESVGDLGAEFERSVEAFFEFARRGEPSSPAGWIDGYRQQLSLAVEMRERFEAWSDRVRQLAAAGQLVYPEGIDPADVEEYREAAGVFVANQVEQSSLMLGCVEAGGGQPAVFTPCVSRVVASRGAGWRAAQLRFVTILEAIAS